MTFWLGRPGTLLTALPHPRKGINPTLTRQSSTVATIGGGRIVGYAPGPGRRQYDMAWSGLDQVTASVLEEFAVGARGPGPFALLDPGRRNHLSANQSAAGSVDLDGTGWTPSAGETVDAVAWPYVRGPRSLRWSLPPSGASAGRLQLDGPLGYPGVPIPAGQPWSFSAKVSGGGADQAVTIAAVLAWLDASGFEIAATIGTPAATASGTWSTVSVSTATPPSAAVYVRAELRATAGTHSSGSTGRGDLPHFPVRLRAASGPSMLTKGLAARGGPAAGSVLHDWWFGGQVEVYVDQPQLELAAAPSAWVLGTGVPLVAMPSLDTSYRTLPKRGHQATFVEIG